MKQAKVFLNNMLAGILTEDDTGYEFRYDSDYLKSDGAVAVSGFRAVDIRTPGFIQRAIDNAVLR